MYDRESEKFHAMDFMEAKDEVSKSNSGISVSSDDFNKVEMIDQVNL